MAWCRPDITFEKDLYFPGETVVGSAQVTTEKDMTARSVEITFLGQAVTAVRPNNKHTNVAADVGIGQRSKETFVEMKHTVWTPSDEKNTFPSGEYKWEFEFELPSNCPSSYESPFAFIRYSVLVQIDVPHWLDTYTEKAVSVSAPLDLNSIPGAREPAEITEKIEMKACGMLPVWAVGPFSRGQVTITMSTEKLGYVSGQTINVSAVINNGTNRDIERVKMSFFRKTSYRREGSPRNIITDKPISPGLTEFRYDRVGLMSGKKELAVPVGASKPLKFTIDIPPCTTTIRSTKCFNVEYYVGLEVKYRSRACSSSAAELNIVVGNIPFLEPGTTELPPHTFEKGPAAECWISRFLKEPFQVKFPYYGKVHKEEPK